jgi:hypothetical protein
MSAVNFPTAGELDMNSLRSEAASRYLAWAKLHSNARFNLASSGVLDYPLAELPVRIEDLEIVGTGPYGFKPLMERLAAKAGVAEECVVYTHGTSMANYIALTALVQPGDEVLVERPTYDPLLTILDHIALRSSRGQGVSAGVGRAGAETHTANTPRGSMQSAQPKQCLYR